MSSNLQGIPPKDGSGGGRRRRSASKRNRTTPDEAIRKLFLNGQMTTIMTCIMIAFVLANAFWLYSRLSYYGSLWIGATPSEVRYAVGPPTLMSGGEGSESWTYAHSGLMFEAQFSNGRLERYTCRVVSATVLCPEIMGVQNHFPESDVLNMYGQPNRVWFVGETKYIAYDELGLIFGLSRLEVSSISVGRAHVDPFTRVLRYLRVFLP